MENKLKQFILLLVLTVFIYSCSLLDTKDTFIEIKNVESGCTLYFVKIQQDDGAWSENLLQDDTISYNKSKVFTVEGGGVYSIKVSKFQSGSAEGLYTSVMGTSPASRTLSIKEGETTLLRYNQKKHYSDYSMSSYLVDEELLKEDEVVVDFSF